MTEDLSKGIYIISAQAKDLFIANHLISDEGKNKIKGYSTKKIKGNGYNFGRYTNSFNYCLDLIKIKEVCDEKGVTFLLKKDTVIDTKEYSNAIINIDFDYNVKVFNNCGDIFSRYGYQHTYKDFPITTIKEDDKEIKALDTGVVLDGDNNLIGIMLKKRVLNPVSEEVLGKYFIYDDKERCYKKSKTKIPTHIFVYGDIKMKLDCVKLREHLYNHGIVVNGKSMCDIKEVRVQAELENVYL